MLCQLLLLAILMGLAITQSPTVSGEATTAVSSSGSVPQFFQTTPELFAGPTITGTPPFLAQSNPAPFGPSRSFVPNSPLETAQPIAGAPNGKSIFQLLGNYSPYFPNPVGFGVDEYPLPAGANITQVHVLHRHGARYPNLTTGIETVQFGERLTNAAGKFNATGALSFLNTWKYRLGAEIQTPWGRQEMFDAGVYHYYQYAQLYDPSTKIIARTTSQDRMLQGAEYFMSGFFGKDWTQNATLEVFIEEVGYNTSLSSFLICDNSKLPVNLGGRNASLLWQSIYLANATSRLQSMITGYNWTLQDTSAAQTMCPYETYAFGYSAWCSLFTYAEWEGFEYSIDLSYAGSFAFNSPTARALGIAYHQEIMARLQQHVITDATDANNITVDNNTATFPLNQSLYFDFSHDTNMVPILTAFGLQQFGQFLPAEGPPPANRSLFISHMMPNAARFAIEIIKTPSPVPADRSYYANSGPPTTYVHFLLSQRTIPLGVSLPACGNRVDGWCEIGAFMDSQRDAVQLANFDFACFGDYPAVPYGTITNGAPQ